MHQVPKAVPEESVNSDVNRAYINAYISYHRYQDAA